MPDPPIAGASWKAAEVKKSEHIFSTAAKPPCN